MLYVCEICGKTFKKMDECFRHEYNEKLNSMPKNKKNYHKPHKKKNYYRQEKKD